MEPNIDETVNWCEENCSASYRKSGYTGNVSFFFINSLDATGFKLRFSDNVAKTEMPKDTVAKKLLKLRIVEAKRDLKDFMEGDTS